MDNPELVILDARWDLMRPDWAEGAYREAHIPGASFLSLDEDLAGKIGANTGRHPLPGVGATVELFRRLGVNNESTVVVYDQASAAFAARAWWILRWLGHQNTCVLDGGLAAWRAAGLPVNDGVPQVRVGNFEGEGDHSWLVEADEILDHIARGVPLIDARDAERFRGQVEPIDAVAGHIPGARNAPFSSFLDDRSCFLPADAIRKRWTRQLDIAPGQDWMVMCGSGVTACHLALSGQIAGLKMPRLYAGSWSEWIRDPSRPVATDSLSGG
jgi:thiosulfate/3-mercaptopyruvate sulfurtransferase